MKYRATQPGFMGFRVRVGDIVEIEGEPPIAGLVPIEEPAAESTPAEATEKPTKASKKQKQATAEPVAETAPEEQSTEPDATGDVI